MITILILWKSDKEALNRTLDSVYGQEETCREGIFLRIFALSGGASWGDEGTHQAAVQREGCAGQEIDCRADLPALQASLRGKYPEFREIQLAGCRAGEMTEILWAGLQTVSTPFVTVLVAGEFYGESALDDACAFLSQEQGRTVGVLLANVSEKKASAAGRKGKAQGLRRKLAAAAHKGKGQAVSARVYSLEKPSEIAKLPGCVHGAVFLAEAFRGGPFTGAANRERGLRAFQGGEAFLVEILACLGFAGKGTAGYVKNALFCGNAALSTAEEMRGEWEDASWYLDTVRQYCLPLLDNLRDANGAAGLFAQAQALFALKTAFQANMEHRNRGVLAGAVLDEYLDLCRECLGKIADSLFTMEETAHPDRRLIYANWSAFMTLKYEDARAISLSPSEEGRAGSLPVFTPVVMLELMEYGDGVWRMDASIERFLTAPPFAFEVLHNGAPVPLTFPERYAEIHFFGRKLVDRRAFALELPEEELGEQNTLAFVLAAGKEKQVLPVMTVDYQSRIASVLHRSYWCFGKKRKFLVRFRRENGKNIGLEIARAGRVSRMAQEARLLKEILTAPYGSKQMFLVRGLYWLTLPYYRRENIWITFDKLYKGGDCGEYFYRYMEGQKNRGTASARLSQKRGQDCGEPQRAKGITPAYVIRGNVPDYKRLREEGFHPLVYRSLRQRLTYLNASMVFATHSSVHGFCGFTKWEIRFVQDRLKAVNTCIQHGLSVQDLSFDSNRVVNNNKRYYCASPCEVENLSKPEYDYGKGVLRLTGIPRYDGLVNRDQKQILIAPTWRSYLAMPAVLGQARGYSPEFRHTEYYRIFQGLLEDERLRRTAQQYGYRILYLLHPVISAQKQDFQVQEGVEIRSASEVDYEALLNASSLMVTDYSGVQFDFAYMRKPVVYFHPPELPPHYGEGGFSYEDQGFGEICTGTEQLVEVLCGYLASGCVLKERYRRREEKFFAYGDRENCRRIFEDALAYQREKIE